MNSITIYKNVEVCDNINAEIEIDETDLITILGELDYDEMIDLWFEANKRRRTDIPTNIYITDDLYSEWFQKVKEQYNFHNAEKILQVK